MGNKSKEVALSLLPEVLPWKPESLWWEKWSWSLIRCPRDFFYIKMKFTITSVLISLAISTTLIWSSFAYSLARLRIFFKFLHIFFAFVPVPYERHPQHSRAILNCSLISKANPHSSKNLCLAVTLCFRIYFLYSFIFLLLINQYHTLVYILKNRNWF